MIRRLAFVTLLFASTVSGNRNQDLFRNTPDGLHNALDLTRPLSDQVTATTCLPEAFVKASGNNFELNGEKFVAVGWNQWEVLEQAAACGPPARYTPLPGREHIIRLMNEGVKTGMKVIRLWTHTITKGCETQPSPGKWDEEILTSLDFVLDEARKRRLKIILVLADNWYTVGGIDSYVEWSPTAKTHQDFFTDSTSKRIFKLMIDTITTRKNTINGRIYGEDPTIMAYNLANEARCQGCPAESIGNWISEMCTFLKSKAPNALVGLGYEGFFHETDSEEMKRLNPGAGGGTWASEEGQAWSRHSKIPCIDYTSCHVWPDNFGTKTIEFQRQFIQSRIDLAQTFNKPFLLEEFGKIVEDRETFSERNKYFASAFELAELNAKQGKLAGSLFWHWYDRGIGLTSKYGIHSNESTWLLVEKHVQSMNAITGVREYCPAK